MLTPRFKLKQYQEYVYITVHAPYTNIGETEINVDEENFRFVSSLYFLRLFLPGKIVQDHLYRELYIYETGDFYFRFTKVNPDEDFQNLDMVTSLLIPRDVPNMDCNVIKVLEERIFARNNSDKAKQIEKILFTEKSVNKESAVDEIDLACFKYSYGFANKTSVEFESIANEFPQIFELKNPDQVSYQERHALRIDFEKRNFCADHYIADFYNEQFIKLYVDVYWMQPEFDINFEFADDELLILKYMPNRQYLLNKIEYKQTMLGLVDILYAFCYDKRTTENQSTAGSSLTISKLSSILSCFCIFNETKQVLIACYRRALTFPESRNFSLCENVKYDLVSMLMLGKKFVVKCLLDIYTLFNLSKDDCYILNQLYIKDYIVFLQKCKKETLYQLANDIDNSEITKTDLELNLLKLEQISRLVHNEPSAVDDALNSVLLYP